ncbi:hypothetical protein ACA910_006131 [Epithemia clementina (nom. ined.)]
MKIDNLFFNNDDTSSIDDGVTVDDDVVSAGGVSPGGGSWTEIPHRRATTTDSASSNTSTDLKVKPEAFNAPVNLDDSFVGNGKDIGLMSTIVLDKKAADTIDGEITETTNSDLLEANEDPTNDHERRGLQVWVHSEDAGSQGVEAGTGNPFDVSQRDDCLEKHLLDSEHSGDAADSLDDNAFSFPDGFEGNTAATRSEGSLTNGSSWMRSETQGPVETTMIDRAPGYQRGPNQVKEEMDAPESRALETRELKEVIQSAGTTQIAKMPSAGGQYEIDERKGDSGPPDECKHEGPDNNFSVSNVSGENETTSLKEGILTAEKCELEGAIENVEMTQIVEMPNDGHLEARESSPDDCKYEGCNKNFSDFSVSAERKTLTFKEGQNAETIFKGFSDTTLVGKENEDQSQALVGKTRVEGRKEHGGKEPHETTPHATDLHRGGSDRSGGFVKPFSGSSSHTRLLAPVFSRTGMSVSNFASDRRNDSSMSEESNQNLDPVSQVRVESPKNVVILSPVALQPFGNNKYESSVMEVAVDKDERACQTALETCKSTKVNIGLPWALGAPELADNGGHENPEHYTKSSRRGGVSSQAIMEDGRQSLEKETAVAYREIEGNFHTLSASNCSKDVKSEPTVLEASQEVNFDDAASAQDDHSFAGVWSDSESEASVDDCGDNFSTTPPYASFDMHRLKECMDNGAAALDQVADKHVVLVLGKTGVGKSLLFQGIAGRTISEAVVKHASCGQTVEKKVFVAKDELPGFEIGHAKKSMTKSIRCFIPESSPGSTKGKCLYVDSPGSEDTDGPEIDVATSVMINQVVRRCKSLRFVFLINYVSLLEDRGSSMRAVLKLIKIFVDNFIENKTSFMFLFTHTNEIKEIPEDNLSGARDCLLKELIRTEEGTNKSDSDVLTILRHMIQCLKKRKSDPSKRRYQIVDVLHPMKSSFGDIANIIEEMKPLGNKFVAGNCGLSPQLHLKFSAGLETLLHRLRLLMTNASKNDANEVKRMSDMILYFSNCMDIEVVRQKVAAWSSLAEKHTESLRVVIEEETRKGTSINSKFGRSNIDALKNAMSQLQVYQAYAADGKGAKELALYVNRKVQDFHKKAMNNDECGYDSLHIVLRNLCTWSEGFEQFSTLYKETRSHFVSRFQNTCKYVSNVDLMQLTTISPGDLASFVEKIRDLEVLCEVAGHLSEHSINLSFACKTVDEARTKMMAAVESLGTTPDNFCKERLGEVANRARAIEFFRDVVDHRLSFPSFMETSTRKLEDMARGVTEHFSNVFAMVVKRSPEFNVSWRQALVNLHGRVLLFDGLKGWEKIQVEYASCLDQIKNIFERKMKVLELRAEETCIHGFKKGADERSAMADVDCCQWLDKCFLRESCFAAVSLQNIRNIYQKRIDFVCREVDTHMSIMVGNSHDSSRSMQLLRNFLLPELCQIVEFDSQFGHKESGVRVQLLDYSKNLEARATKLLQTWEIRVKKWKQEISKVKCGNMDTRLQQDLFKSGSEVEDILRRCESFITLHPAFDQKSYENLHKTVQKQFQGFVLDLQVILECKGRYLAKQFSLDLLEKLTSLSHIGLGDIAAMKEITKISVQKHANTIMHRISENEEWEKINKEMNVFEKSILIDRFTSNQGSSCLQSIRLLREEKEEGVVGELKSLILANDYHGVVELLKRYAQSKGHATRQTRMLQHIVSNALLAKLDKASADISSHRLDRAIIQGVASDIGILTLAKEHLDDLARGCGLYLPRDLPILITLVNEVLCAKAKEMKIAGKRADFVELGSAKLVLSAFAELSIQPYLTKKTKTELEGSLAEYEKYLKSVSEHVDAFFSSSLTEGTSLLGDLNSLKLALDNESPKLEELGGYYETIVKKLIKRLNNDFREISVAVEERRCFDEAIAWMHWLKKQMSLGLHEHVSLEKLSFDCTEQLDEWRSKKIKYDQELEFEGLNAGEKLDKWARSLDDLHPKSKLWGLLRSGNESSYKRLCSNLEQKVDRVFAAGKAAVNTTKDLVLTQENINLLDLISNKVGAHIPTAAERSDVLKKTALEAFLRFCHEAQEALQSGGISRFQRFFSDYRSFVLYVPYTMLCDGGKNAFTKTNQLIYQVLDREIDELKGMMNTFDFRKIKETIESVRASGGFVADRLTLLHEEVECSDNANVDRWLDKIRSLCVTYFSSGRDLSRIKHYAILGLPPSASKAQITQAYNTTADRIKMSCSNERDSRAALRNVESAYTDLMHEENTGISESQPFENMIRAIGNNLRDKVRGYLIEQRYDLVEHMLFNLDGLSLLDGLVSPPLDSSNTYQGITLLVKNHVDGVRVDVNTNWSERKFKALNDNIADLKQMEASFKAYPEIFPESWNTGIVQEIETEIESLGARARGYLESKATAFNKFDDFRRCFVRLGFVLNELICFKDCTKSTMCSVLECCLNADWGHGFLFELGLSLQRGDENADDEENRICQVIVAEFSHFKEVQTMVWNEETCQKPADDTVHDIRGEQQTSSSLNELDIDKDQLLRRFWEFETTYSKLLGDYLSPNADINDLVQQVIRNANQLKPVECSAGWGTAIKDCLPTIVAGVFAVFTVLKSAASYNRIEDQGLGEKILMKPHNIQVLTILCMLGCGDLTNSSLESQVMQIRTGEGKSLILGATAVILALLGFRVRCVCYSEYLSNRDYDLFKDLFSYFQIIDRIKYSKITTLSEDCTRSKGDIRKMTQSLLEGKLASTGTNAMKQGSTNALEQEILIVDEFDVFFGSDFYGQTYNQVFQLQDPDVAEILKYVWSTSKRVGHRLKLTEIQGIRPYHDLIRKYKDYSFLLDNEISLMIDQVKRFDDEPYHLDQSTDRIGYQVMDSIEYDVTYGYCTMFAYLHEAEKGNLKNADAVLANVLGMPVSCGQFSYANISPLRILGVSGTVEAMGRYEHDVLGKYGIERFVYVPSVYGKSNFQFDAAGEGIHIEQTKSDFYHKITEVILDVTKQKRAVIVFFYDVTRLREYKSSSFYKKLGRNVKMLTEDMSADDKGFVVKKAATAGQITLCTASFGRGTDFFCKDDVVQRNGGVHIIQAFLSEELSEELQIKGRTARQGKKGSYQMILLEPDLEKNFGIEAGSKDSIAREDRHEWLSCARKKKHESHCHVMDANLENATEKDKKSHELLNALLKGDEQKGLDLFKELYFTVKTQSLAANTEIDLAFVIDVTGSMGPYISAIFATIKTLVDKQGAVMGRLQANYPDTEFTFHVAVMGFRDIDDGNAQFRESLWKTKSHFTENTEEAIRFVRAITNPTSGGGDLAEDVLGAIDRCARWNEQEDWKSRLKFMMVLTDAPAHGLVDPSVAGTPNTDDYATSHPKGLTTNSVVDVLVKRGIDLFMCSFNPTATSRTEQEISKKYRDHPNNRDQREATLIPLVPSTQQPGASDPNVSYNRHIIFVLDESGSMCNDWNGVVVAYNQYLARRQQYQCDSDLVSVVQFAHASRATVQQCKIRLAPRSLYYGDGGTNFGPAAASACTLARATPPTHVPVVVFMSDGEASDACQARSCFMSLNSEIRGRTGRDLELHVIAFRSNASQAQLAQIASASSIGKVRASSDTTDLTKVFEEIAGGANVAGLLEAEIGKRVSEAVGNKLALEFMG